MFNTLHHKIIYDERDIWVNSLLILAFALWYYNDVTVFVVAVILRLM